MCTVTFLPVSEREFIITSNRDESVHRPAAVFPQIKEMKHCRVLFPMDMQAGGTWIATADNGRTVCLMNGAFERHIPQPPYRKSRGLVVLDSFLFDEAKNFIVEYDLSGIEPFTMLLFEVKEKKFLTELRWDGNKKFTTEINAARPGIWASATLYSKALVEKREKWFREWLEVNKIFSTAAIRQFHHFGGEGNIATDVKMNRNNELMTVSITSVIFDGKKSKMIYEDLKANKIYEDSVPVNS